MSTAVHHIKLATRLPPRLTRFFARYPPKSISDPSEPAEAAQSAPQPFPSSVDATKSPSQTASITLSSRREFVHPFRPQKHETTGKWHDPVFSLRRQADLVKLAREHGVEELLPFTIKGTAERLRRREENGLRVKGTGIGQKVKGKEWERTLKGRLEKRRQAMLEMPQMIQTWKERGHGRGWKKWPK